MGIKYGGKGDVDVTGLEMELREPYKVPVGRIPCTVDHSAGVEHKLDFDSTCTIHGLADFRQEVNSTIAGLSPGLGTVLSSSGAVRREAPTCVAAFFACFFIRPISCIRVLFFHVPKAVRWLDSGRAGGAADGDLTVPRARRGERVGQVNGLGGPATQYAPGI